MPDDRIALGISSCLLGQPVRYDGGHKLDHYLRDTLGRFMRWVPVCPEVECGLSIPRESMRLVGDPESPKLLGNKTGTDYTGRLVEWARDKVRRLEFENLCGFVFKSKSPSSGIRGVKLYEANGVPSRRGIGLFAREFMARFPLIPVEDDGRIHDPGIRANFIERVLVYSRWLELIRARATVKALVDFHTEHKLLIMAHSIPALRELGRLVAGIKKPSQALFDQYIASLMRALSLVATVKKNVNVLQHAMGYFKKHLTADEKAELLEVIGSYHGGSAPLVVPIVLLNHYVRKYGEPYLARQRYLAPHPAELALLASM